jgi:hypothetical protein
MNITTISSTGHFAMFHTATAELPIPTAEPTLLASGPVRTSATSTSASRTRGRA